MLHKSSLLILKGFRSVQNDTLCANLQWGLALNVKLSLISKRCNTRSRIPRPWNAPRSCSICFPFEIIHQPRLHLLSSLRNRTARKITSLFWIWNGNNSGPWHCFTQALRRQFRTRCQKNKPLYDSSIWWLINTGVHCIWGAQVAWKPAQQSLEEGIIDSQSCQLMDVVCKKAVTRAINKHFPQPHFWQWWASFWVWRWNLNLNPLKSEVTVNLHLLNCDQKRFINYDTASITDQNWSHLFSLYPDVPHYHTNRPKHLPHNQ